ncbi:MAG: hypothetical protein H7X97_04600 [Opitutaceae bacterium]|nr:hypothetical protein [Verrucomicrobiales bacterium]
MDAGIGDYRVSPDFLLWGRRFFWSMGAGMICGQLLFIFAEAGFDPGIAWLQFIDYLAMTLFYDGDSTIGQIERELLQMKFHWLFLLPLLLPVSFIVFLVMEAPVRHFASDSGITSIWFCRRSCTLWNDVSNVEIVETPSGEQVKVILITLEGRTHQIHGITQMADFLEVVRQRIAPGANWRTIRRPFDTKSLWTALAFGACIPFGEWLTATMYRHFGFQAASLGWSTILFMVAGVLVWRRPIFENRLAKRSEELTIAATITVLSVQITWFNWVEPVLIPAFDQFKATMGW